MENRFATTPTTDDGTIEPRIRNARVRDVAEDGNDTVVEGAIVGALAGALIGVQLGRHVFLTGDTAEDVAFGGFGAAIGLMAGALIDAAIE